MLSRLERLLELYQINPQDSFVLFALGKEFEGKDDPDQALHFYNALQSLDPNYVGLYYHLGKLYERLNQHEKALEAYNRGLEVAHNAHDAHAASELQGAKLNLEYEI